MYIIAHCIYNLVAFLWLCHGARQQCTKMCSTKWAWLSLCSPRVRFWLCWGTRSAMIGCTMFTRRCFSACGYTVSPELPRKSKQGNWWTVWCTKDSYGGNNVLSGELIDIDSLLLVYIVTLCAMGASGWLSDMPNKFCTDELVASDFRIFFFRYMVILISKWFQWRYFFM